MQREKILKKKTEHDIQEPWDYNKRCNVHINEIPEGEKRERKRKKS